MLTVCYINRQPGRGCHYSDTNACGESAASKKCIYILPEILSLTSDNGLAHLCHDIIEPRHEISNNLVCAPTQQSLRSACAYAQSDQYAQADRSLS